jgi:murein DD-endopeptidase MepM/ murein hydrolase activator NlpD
MNKMAIFSRTAIGFSALLAVVLSMPTVSSAQTKKRAPQKKAAPTAIWTKTDCGENVELRISAASGTQGSLLQAELRSSIPLKDVLGRWDEKPVPIWQETLPFKAVPAASKKTAAATTADLHRALIGIDLEKPAGTYDLAINAKSDGAAIACNVQIAVRAGKFATEHLKVAPNFVEPNPEQLAKAQEDSKHLRELYATITPEKLWQGKFRIPLDGVTTGGNFGKRRILNGTPSSPHTGVDMPALTGTPVHASQRGRVVLAEELYFSGNTVLIDHGLGIYTLYGHFSEIDVKPGDMVEADTVIGKVGATGRVTGPHLHWGLTVDRARVNALSIVAAGIK